MNMVGAIEVFCCGPQIVSSLNSRVVKSTRFFGNQFFSILHSILLHMEFELALLYQAQSVQQLTY